MGTERVVFHEGLASVQASPAAWAALYRLALLGHATAARRDGGVPHMAPSLQALLNDLGVAASGKASVTLATRGSDDGQWVTVSQAAELIGCTSRNVRWLAGSGRLISRRHGRDWQIERQSACEYGRSRAA